MGLTLAACEDTSDLGTMQVNPEPTIAEANGVKVTYNFPDSLNLNNYVNKEIPLLDIEIKKDMPEGALVEGTLQIAADGDFKNAVELPITSVVTPAREGVDEGTHFFKGVVDGNAWGDAFVKIYNTIAPVKKPNSIRYNLYIKDNGSIYNYEYVNPETGATEDWWPTKTLNVTSVNANLDVADSYRLFYTGGPAEGVVMNHSAAHKYDDPVFSYVIDITDEMLPNFKWYVTPADNTSEKYGLSTLPGNAPTNAQGDLMVGGEQIQVPGAGPYKISVNMFLKKYSVSLAANNLFVQGANVTLSLAQNFALTTDNYVNYSGYAYISGGWALSTGAKPSDPKYGYADGKFTQLKADQTPLKDFLVPNDSKVTAYFVNVDLGTMSYDLKPLETVGLVGTINNWGATEDIALKQAVNISVAKTLKYTGEVTLKADDMIKVRANNNWDSGLNMTGTLNADKSKDGVYVFDLGYGNDNISAPEAGTYAVTVLFQTVKNAAGVYERAYTLELKKK